MQALRAASEGDGDGDFRAIFCDFRAILRRYAVASNPAPHTHSGDFRVTVTTSQFLVAMCIGVIFVNVNRL